MLRTAALAGMSAILAAALVAAVVGVMFGVGTAAGETRPDSAPTNGASPRVEAADPDATFYVIGYHWGWAVFNEDGRELDNIRVKDGTAVEIYAVTGDASDAIKKLPAPVAAVIHNTDWHARTRKAIEAGLISLPEGVTVEEALGEGHQEGGHDEDGHDEDVHPEESHDEDVHPEESHDEDVHDEKAGSETPMAMPGKDGHKEAPMAVPGKDGQVEPILLAKTDHGFLIPWYGVAKYLAAEAQEPTRVVFTADKSKVKKYEPGDQRSVEFVCTNYCGLGHPYMAQKTMLIVD